MPDEVKQTVWCDRLIDGPHKNWNGEIWIHYPTLYERLVNKIAFYFRKPLPINFRNYSFSKYDILFSHFGYRAWHDYQYVQKVAIKKIVRFYGCDIGITPKLSGWGKRYKIIFDVYDLFICEGPYMAKQLEILGAPKDKIKWLHIGIDPSLIVKDLIPTKYLIEPLCIMIAGTFTEKKGIEYALKGILQFVKKIPINIKLTVVGDVNPREPDQLKTKYRINNIINILRKEKKVSIKQTGYVPLSTLISLMRKNLVIISPSVRAKNGDIEGGLPVTLTYAAAEGMILIGTDHCDLPEIVQNNKNGFICKEKSSEDICEALISLVSSDLSICDKMRKNSQEIVRTEFNSINLGNQIHDLFISILS